MSQGIGYNVDVVLCIDATGSMGPFIDEVKANALKLHGDILAVLEQKDKQVSEFRVRVVAFRDVRCDDRSIEESPFFVLPDEEGAFASFVNAVIADGGGDAPESGLHALGVALASDWTKAGDKRRHIVVMWTDTSTHPVEEGSYPAGVSGDVAKSLDELTEQWDVGQDSLKLETNARRLVIFAPDDPSWNQLEAWEQVVHYTSQAGKGLSDIDYGAILDAIAGSV